MNVLIIDNYDSFTYNLVHGFGELGVDRIDVVRNDAVEAEEILQRRPDAITISPGPGRPEHAGASMEIVRKVGPHIPILGVCLGHQVIAAAYGGVVRRSGQPFHGKSSLIFHTGEGILAGLPSPFLAGRYHSLIVDPERPGKGLRITARTEDGTVMALRHEQHPVHGVQFHPESIMTAHGNEILAGFLRLAKQGVQA